MIRRQILKTLLKPFIKQETYQYYRMMGVLLQ